MPCGSFIFTPKPLVWDVTIQDPKADNGVQFKYPDREIDQLHHSPDFEEVYVGMFDPLKNVLPKYGCEVWSQRLICLPEWKDSEPEKYDVYVRALYRFAAFIRKTVSEMGELWYTEQWMETITDDPDKMCIRTMNIDELELPRVDKDFFIFTRDIFYKFVDDKNEQT